MAPAMIMLMALSIFCLCKDLWAQTDPTRNFPVERFRLSLDREGIFQVEWGATPTHLSFNTALWIGLQNEPLVVVGTLSDSNTTERVGALVQQRIGGSFVSSLGLFDRFQIALELPLILQQTENPGPVATGETFSTQGIGNLRLVGKLQVLKQEHHGIDAAILPTIHLPSRSANDYFGDDAMTYAPEMAASRRFGSWRLAVNVGYLLRPKKQVFDLMIDDEVFVRIGSGMRLGSATKPLEINITASLNSAANKPFQNANQNYIELLAGCEYSVNTWVALFAAGSMGFGSGFGAPEWRVVSGLKFGRLAPSDRDRDGIYDVDDVCADEPEDRDGFADTDGCSEDDNDQDGIQDTLDQCPNEPENINQVDDNDGCPELDQDSDGVWGSYDACPEQAGPEDNNGCPIPDQDQDGIADDQDICADVPGSASFEGCPDAKTLQIKIGDVTIVKDAAYNTSVGDPNIQVSKELTLEVQNAAINAGKLLRKIRFNFANAGIKRSSYKTIDAIGNILKTYPEMKIHLNAYTCSIGSAQFNLRLSSARAKNVKKMLTERGGAHPEQIEVQSFGEEKPVATNKTAKGRAANRRVEIIVEKRQQVSAK